MSFQVGELSLAATYRPRRRPAITTPSCLLPICEDCASDCNQLMEGSCAVSQYQDRLLSRPIPTQLGHLRRVRSQSWPLGFVTVIGPNCASLSSYGLRLRADPLPCAGSSPAFKDQSRALKRARRQGQKPRPSPYRASRLQEGKV